MALGDRRRERREERRDERRGVGRTTYRMRQKLVAIGDDYWIEDEQGRRLFKVNGKAMRVRDTIIIEDASGRTVATVKKAMITPLRDRFSVDVADGDDMDVQGNIVDHEYHISQGGEEVAEVSKKWF